MSARRAFITGLGIVSPAGRGCAQVLQSLQAGTIGLGPLTLFAPSSKGAYPVGEVVDWAPDATVPRTHALALEAATQALADDGRPPEAIVLGATTGGLPLTEQLLREGVRDPARYCRHGTGTVATYLAERLGCTGPVYTVSTACSSGALALKIALELIRSGQVSRVLAGGADALCRLTYFGFGMLQLIDPSGARPFHRDRAGMSVGEAAAMLLLQAADLPPPGAQAELLGGGFTCDAYHPAAPHPEGRGAQRAMEAALADARVGPRAVSYVNLHGTGTPDNDAAEARAIHQLFGSPLPPLSSSKDAFSHSLAASGAVEAVISTLALVNGLVPATPSCQQPDPDLGIEPVLRAKPADLELVLSNSFGFGGNNVSLVFGRPDRKAPARAAPAAVKKLAVLGSACITGAGHTAASLVGLKQGTSLGGVCPLAEVTAGLPARQLRRMKRLPKLATALGSRCCAEAEWAPPPAAIFVGTAYGSLSETADFLDALDDSQQEFASPTDFVGSVHNAVAGQLAIRFQATGANLTATGEDDAFEQALFLAGQFLPSQEGLGLVLGVDEAHPLLTPLVDPNALADRPADGGGALLVGLAEERAVATLAPIFFAASATEPEQVDSLLAALGGSERIKERFAAVLVGMPISRRSAARPQLARFLAASEFDGPVIDYRQFTGEFATAAAIASVLAVALVGEGLLPSGLSGRADLALAGKGILLLGLGASLSAIEVCA